MVHYDIAEYLGSQARTARERDIAFSYGILVLRTSKVTGETNEVRELNT